MNPLTSFNVSAPTLREQTQAQPADLACSHAKRTHLNCDCVLPRSWILLPHAVVYGPLRLNRNSINAQLISRMSEKTARKPTASLKAVFYRRSLLLISSGRFSFSGTNIVRSFTCVVFGANFNRHFALCGRSVEQLFEKRNTPAATRPCSTAFADFTGNSRLVKPYEIHNFPLSDVKAITKLVVRLHKESQSERNSTFTSAQGTTY